MNINPQNRPSLSKTRLVYVVGKDKALVSLFSGFLVEKIKSFNYNVLKEEIYKPIFSFLREIGWDGVYDKKSISLIESLINSASTYKETALVEAMFSRIAFDDFFPFDFVIVDDLRKMGDMEFSEKGLPRYLYDTMLILVGEDAGSNVDYDFIVSPTSNIIDAVDDLFMSILYNIK